MSNRKLHLEPRVSNFVCPRRLSSRIKSLFFPLRNRWSRVGRRASWACAWGRRGSSSSPRSSDTESRWGERERFFQDIVLSNVCHACCFFTAAMKHTRQEACIFQVIFGKEGKILNRLFKEYFLWLMMKCNDAPLTWGQETLQFPSVFKRKRFHFHIRTGRWRRDPRRRHPVLWHRAPWRGGGPAASERLQADRLWLRQPAQQGGAQRIPQVAGEIAHSTLHVFLGKSLRSVLKVISKIQFFSFFWLRGAVGICF